MNDNKQLRKLDKIYNIECFHYDGKYIYVRHYIKKTNDAIWFKIKITWWVKWPRLIRLSIKDEVLMEMQYKEQYKEQYKTFSI